LGIVGELDEQSHSATLKTEDVGLTRRCTGRRVVDPVTARETFDRALDFAEK